MQADKYLNHTNFIFRYVVQDGYTKAEIFNGLKYLISICKIKLIIYV